MASASMASAKLGLRDGGLREHGRRERCLHDDTARLGTPVPHVLAERLDNQGLTYHSCGFEVGLRGFLGNPLNCLAPPGDPRVEPWSPWGVFLAARGARLVQKPTRNVAQQEFPLLVFGAPGDPQGKSRQLSLQGKVNVRC